jgi:hypothetical protein
MNARLREILSHQQAARFAGLTGSEAEATIRVSDQLLNELIAAHMPPEGPLRSIVIRSHAGNRLDVAVKRARPAFLPAVPLTLVIERQPELPVDPVIVLRLASGVGTLVGLAGPFLGLADRLPPFLRMDGQRLLVDVRGVLQQGDQSALLDYVRQLRVVTEDGGLAIHAAGRIPERSDPPTRPRASSRT